MSRPLLAVAALGVGVVAALTGCASAGPGTAGSPTSSETVQPITAGRARIPFSISSEDPLCAATGSVRTCRLRVWYANQSDTEITIDASSTVVLDDLGAEHVGSPTAATAKALAIAPLTRALVVIDVVLPVQTQPAAVVWTSSDGRSATFELPLDETETPTQPAATPAPIATPTRSVTAPVSRPPTHAATPAPKPTRARPATPRSTPTPTRSTPVGSIG